MYQVDTEDEITGSRLDAAIQPLIHWCGGPQELSIQDVITRCLRFVQLNTGKNDEQYWKQTWKSLALAMYRK